MPELKYHIETLGCRTNQADSAALCRLLEDREYAASRATDADLMVVNTCTVTSSADQDSRQIIRKLRRQNPRARLVVIGCYARRAPEELLQIGGVDGVVGHEDRQGIAALVGGTPPVPDSFPPAALAAGRTRPFVKIQDGCDARCSFCIVPHVRGPACSAEPAQVLRQVRELIREGHQEVVLTGIHLGTYGRKLADPTTLATMVRQILDLPGLGRLRLSGIEPMRFSRALVKMAAENPKLARHFHIPLQSGSERILRLMRRPYRPKQFSDLVHEIAARLPGAAIGTDVIAGFPGETEAEHGETVRLLEESPLTHVHVFSYSRRSGTDAAQCEETPSQIVRRRSQELRRLAARKKAKFEEGFWGCRMKALTLQPDRKIGFSRVLTGNYLMFQLTNVILEPNRWVEVVVEPPLGGMARARLPQHGDRPPVRGVFPGR